MRLVAFLLYSMAPTRAAECPAQIVDGEQVRIQAGTGGNPNAVYERTGIYLITDTQKHDMLVLGGGSEEPVGQTYVCTKRYHGGWGVNLASCCDCKASDPLTATRANSYGPTNTAQGYGCYSDCNVCGGMPPSPPPPAPCECETLSILLGGDALTWNSGAAGDYTLLPGVEQSGRKVFKKAGAEQYIFFSGDFWFVGSDYNKAEGLLTSAAGDQPACPEHVPSWEYKPLLDWITGDISVACPAPPSPPCCDSVTVTIIGAAVDDQNDRDGEYRVHDGVTVGGRPVYQKREGRRGYLYFLPSSADWVIGNDYDADMIGVRSNTDDNPACPADVHARGWEYYGGAVWYPGGVEVVCPVSSPPPFTCSCETITVNVDNEAATYQSERAGDYARVLNPARRAGDDDTHPVYKKIDSDQYLWSYDGKWYAGSDYTTPDTSGLVSRQDFASCPESTGRWEYVKQGDFWYSTTDGVSDVTVACNNDDTPVTLPGGGGDDDGGGGGGDGAS